MTIGGLGSGLDFLYDENATEVQVKKTLRVSELEPNRDQPRKQFSDEAIQTLADSIQQYGMIQPILVRPLGLNYQIVAGERRWRAARMLGMDEVPVVIRELTDEETMAVALIENLQREDLNPLEEANAYVQSKAEAIKTKATEAQFAENKAAGEKFLAENAKKEGVKTTSSGLQYKIIKEGNGAVPTDSSKVKVNYKGTLIDGTQFDSSYDRKEPTTFRANQVIKGWTEALTMMPVGSKWELYIPQELAYGSREAGTIKPFSTLIFEVELLSIEK